MIRTIDATLREGCQAAGVSFSDEATARIGELLANAGVDMVECGQPISGAGVTVAANVQWRGGTSHQYGQVQDSLDWLINRENAQRSDPAIIATTDAAGRALVENLPACEPTTMLAVSHETHALSPLEYVIPLGNFPFAAITLNPGERTKRTLSMRPQ